MSCTRRTRQGTSRPILGLKTSMRRCPARRENGTARVNVIDFVMTVPHCFCGGCVLTFRRKWQHYYVKSVSGNITIAKIVVIVTLKFHSGVPNS